MLPVTVAWRPPRHTSRNRANLSEQAQLAVLGAARAGVPEPLAKEALRLAGQKLPVKTKIVKREADLFES